MSDLFKNAQTRRAFFRTLGLGSAAVGLMSMSEARAMLTRLRTSDKPIFTEPTLNRFIMNAKRDPELYERYARQATTDLKRFLMTHFELTEFTLQRLDAMPRREQAELNDGIETSVRTLKADWDDERATPLYVHFTEPEENTQASTQSTTLPSPVDVDVDTGGDTDIGGDVGGDVIIIKTTTITIGGCGKKSDKGFMDPRLPEDMDPSGRY